MSEFGEIREWSEVLATLEGQAPGTVYRLPKWPLPLPADDGAYPTIGLPEGQNSDFRFRLQDGRGLHVRVFEDRYEAHLDEGVISATQLGVPPKDGPDEHLVTSGGLGALLGLVVGGKREAMLVGGLLGMALGALAKPKADDPGEKTT
jgi:hypothetical protein